MAEVVNPLIETEDGAVIITPDNTIADIARWAIENGIGEDLVTMLRYPELVVVPGLFSSMHGAMVQ